MNGNSKLRRSRGNQVTVLSTAAHEVTLFSPLDPVGGNEQAMVKDTVKCKSINILQQIQNDTLDTTVAVYPLECSKSQT